MGNKYLEYSKLAKQQRLKRRSCTAKRAFDTPEQAYQKGQQVYQCPFCGKYHRSGAFANLRAKLRKKRLRYRARS